jgi:hypothetical protein
MGPSGRSRTVVTVTESALASPGNGLLLPSEYVDEENRSMPARTLYAELKASSR